MEHLVYVLNRDSHNHVTISSPLEANKSQTIVFTTEGLDVGYDNPLFACLEINYGDADEDPTGEACKQAEKAYKRVFCRKRGDYRKCNDMPFCGRSYSSRGRSGRWKNNACVNYLEIRGLRFRENSVYSRHASDRCYGLRDFQYENG